VRIAILLLFQTYILTKLGEGNFDDASAKPSGAATPAEEPVETPSSTPAKRGRGRGPGKGTSKRAKTTKERLRLIDGDGGLD
jgi:DNA helicase INO80